MRIDPKAPVLPVAAATAPRRNAGTARFMPEEGKRAGGSSATASAASLQTMDAILALQEEGDPRERRRRAARRGHDLLDDLDRLKAALLGGRVAAGDLAALAARLASRNEGSGDPRLDDIIQHIELRAQVELAKLKRP